MHKLFFFPLLFICLMTKAQGIDVATASKSITAAGLKEHLSIIASAEMQGREAGTEGERKAAAYLISQYRKFSMKPGYNGNYKLPFTLYQAVAGKSELKINGETATLDQDYWINNAYLPINTLKTNAIIYVGSSFNDKSKLDVKGKILVSTENEESSGRKVTAAQKLGAAAMIIIAKSNANPPSVTNGRPRLSKSPSGFAYFMVSKSFGSKLLGGSKPFTEQEWTEIPKGVYTAYIEWTAEQRSKEIPSANVIAYLPAKEKTDEYLFITSHYDHEGIKNGVIYYGADDDGSGTASVVAIAGAFANAAKHGFVPKRNIVFMNVSGEEKGLLGSQYYAEHPVFPLEKTTADLNIDMVGRIDPTYKGDSLNYVYIIGEEKISSDLQKITNSINNEAGHLELDRTFNDPNDPNRFYYRSDHYNFAAKGVPVLFYFNGTHKDYHQPSDTIEKINFDLMEKRVRFIFHTAWEIAMKEEMLKRDMPLDMPSR